METPTQLPTFSSPGTGFDNTIREHLCLLACSAVVADRMQASMLNTMGLLLLTKTPTKLGTPPSTVAQALR